jgi:hypothetical protein
VNQVAQTIFLQEFTVPPLSQQMPARFASLTPSPTPSRGWGLAHLFTAPFYDVDDRAARLAAAAKRERELRQAAMSDGDAPHD